MSDVDWQGLQDRWDAQQSSYLVGRQERFSLLARLVELVAGPRVTILDLGCGTGSLTSALLEALPRADVVGVDADPALLRIAAETVGRDQRVTLVRADLRAADWVRSLPGDRFGAAVSATALHWLAPPRVRELYGELARLVMPGGFFADADHTPLAAPRLSAAASALQRMHADAARTEGALDWERWWDELSASGAVEAELAERESVFGGERHPDEQAPDAAWRLEALSGAGFTEAAVVWRNLQDAITAAVR